jgi:hypothetical protein
MGLSGILAKYPYVMNQKSKLQSIYIIVWKSSNYKPSI